MQNQKTIGFREQRGSASGRKVVLYADRETYDSLCMEGCLNLRLFTTQGNSVILRLESKEQKQAQEDFGESGIVCVTLKREEFLSSVERNLEIVFMNREFHEAAHFRVVAVSSDQWLSSVPPLSESIQ
ncbi:hypothetical protein L0Y65_03860 [Candidatus Micrarchaeota archaeon]|nr:hypothetical protein [Candidatus Micrarchaeota archaeon]